MKHYIELLGVEYTVEYEYRITCRGAPATGPSFSSPGEPEEPMEYEVHHVMLFKDDTQFELTPWLVELIEQELQDSDKVYNAIYDDVDIGGDNDYDERD